MMETVREMIARIDAEMQAAAGWLEIERLEDGPHLASSGVRCQADAVEFDDDAGFTTRIPYGSVVAIRFGRQGEAMPLATLAAPRVVVPLRATG
ncbi:hypothetical protein SAMN02745157_3947 [Kaistia soli DSM 19436]|uniref:Uncharacterized protein n=1 Tax=Kaistia soli DSM 19436 TaxID=1122133 RepID=A0A1M5INB5_9HYPH|nr:hypothetical protein [Kaistia soli]SHG29731.1 hypothetical protein SAMN02745157_3947 [Kaistia soli DSM 19436]